MAKKNDLTQEEKAVRRKYRDYQIQRNFEYETTTYNELTQEKIRDLNADPNEWRQKVTEEIDAIFENEKIEYLFYIFHDKDRLSDGSDKGMHVHILVRFESPRYQESVMKLFNASRNKSCEHVRSRFQFARYMLHITEDAINDNKHIYSSDEIVMLKSETCKFSSIVEFIASKKQSEVEKEEIESAIRLMQFEARTQGLTYREARTRIYDLIDIDEIEEKQKKVEDALQSCKKQFLLNEEEFLEDKARTYIKKGRRLQNFFISGQSATGKTVLASALAERFSDERGVHVAAVGGKGLTFDFVNTYRGETATRLDEIKGGSFDMRMFLSTFDPYSYTPVNSRNNDKHWLANYSFMTTSESLQQFRSDMILYSKGGSKYALSKELLEDGNRFLYVKDSTRFMSEDDFNAEGYFYDKDDFVRTDNLKQDNEVKDISLQIMRRFEYMIHIEKLDDAITITLFKFRNDDHFHKGFKVITQIETTTDFHSDVELRMKIVDVLERYIMSDDEHGSSIYVMHDLFLQQNTEYTFTMNDLKQKHTNANGELVFDVHEIF